MNNIESRPLNITSKTPLYSSIVFSDLREKIKEHKIDPPNGKTADQLTEWFLGYQAALFDVYEVIGEFERRG